MKKRRLGNSDLEITPIGLGTRSMCGAGPGSRWDSQDDRDFMAAIRAGLDLGINWIDTAATCGFGHAEEVIGQVIKGHPHRPYIFTKCSMISDDNRKISTSLKAVSIRQECEQSLRRLNVDVIDLYQIHWPLPEDDIEEAWVELAKLQEQGKVRYIGVSNFSLDHTRRAHRIAPITSLRPAYSLLAREAESDILPFAQRQKIGVIACSPLCSGLLSGKMTRERIAQLPDGDRRKRDRNFMEPLLGSNLRLVALLIEIGLRHGLTAAEVAIAWTLNNPVVTGSIVGVKKPQQVTEIVGSAAFSLSANELLEIVRVQGAETEELLVRAS